MRSEFATATRVLFGPGTLAEVAHAAKALGKRALLVVGRDVGRAEPLRERLGAHGIAMVVADLPAVVAETQRASSTKGNPIALTDKEFTEVLRQALLS